MRIDFRKIGNAALKVGKVVAQVAHVLSMLKRPQGEQRKM